MAVDAKRAERSRLGHERRAAGVGPASPITRDDMAADEVEFGQAVDEFRRRVRRFPTNSDVLTIAKTLGYRKVAEPAQ
jgi:hypothetical protein